MSLSNYEATYGAYKSLKDWLMGIGAIILAVAGANAIGIVQQCPEAVLTFAGSAITLKALLNFINNYRKHNSIQDLLLKFISNLKK